MDKKKIIALLNKDLEDEHGAIIQYLTHAYSIGEGEMACEIEATARDEMRHLDWLAETIVELGGVPSMKRGTMLMGKGSVVDWMKNNVSLEEGALKQYTEHIKAIDNLKIKRLLKRILSDEKAHHGDFANFVVKAQKKNMKDITGTRSDKIAQTLNWGIEHEYTVILQYMLQSYLTTNKEAKKQFEDQGINEMQHLGWLAEKMIDMGGKPKIEHTKVNQSKKTAGMLRADIKIEKEVADIYNRAARESKDVKLKNLFLRLRDNERYHVDVFTEVLKKEEKQD